MRLIDADKFREDWMKFQTFEPMKLLDLQPTAYDVDKVVEELEEKAERQFGSACNEGEWSFNLAIPLDKAIEIVKGGVNE